MAKIPALTDGGGASSNPLRKAACCKSFWALAPLRSEGLIGSEDTASARKCSNGITYAMILEAAVHGLCYRCAAGECLGVATSAVMKCSPPLASCTRAALECVRVLPGGSLCAGLM